MSKENSEGTEDSGSEAIDYNADEGGDYPSFDDLGDDTYEETEIQGLRDSDDEDDAPAKPAKKDPKIVAKQKKKEDEKKAKGQKGDDLETLDTLDDSEFEVEEEEEEAPAEVEEEEATEEEAESSDENSKSAKPKGKPTYVTIDGESFAVPSDALISTQVDGKTEKLTLQELKNHYAGKVAWDKKFNEVNVKEQTIKQQESAFNQKFTQFTGVKQKIEEIISNPEKNPKDALKIFLDQFDVDSYDLMDRMFKADLVELSNVLNMETSAERKAYFLEKKNSHLLEQSQKRKSKDQESEKVNTYRQQTDALRKSSGVSEAQYVDAYEELKSYGYEDKNLSEKEIVEWAATKPHREVVGGLLKPYKDQFSDDVYGELSWKLANILRSGSETSDIIKKHLADVYGVPTEVKQLSKKLNPLGRKAGKPSPASSINKKNVDFESFDDLEEDD